MVQGVFYSGKMKKITLYSISIIILIILGGYLLLGKTSANSNAIVGSNSGDFQKITLSIKNYNYYPNTITVKANQPVRIYLDESVVGCYRSFTIRQLGIAKYLRTPSDYLEFTPTKQGTYGFACSMGMGTGTLVVE